MNNKLNIVSFDIPYPANYGGIVEVLNKLKVLKQNGYYLILHCFEYRENTKSKFLSELVDEVFYYERKFNIIDFFSCIPFIVKSRENKQLLKNLISNDFPILFEAIHTTFYINSDILKNRKKAIWMHNNEANYYLSLFKYSRNIFKKIYFYFEYLKLRNYQENYLKYSDYVYFINKSEFSFFEKKNKNCFLVTPLNIMQKSELIKSQEGYILIHASLDIDENINSITWLLENVIKYNYKLIIAGKNPKKYLVNYIDRYDNVKLIPNPNDKEMISLIQNSNIVLIHSFQNSGVKIKFLSSIIYAKKIITNQNIGLEIPQNKTIKIVLTKEDYKNELEQLFLYQIDNQDIIERNVLINRITSYKNTINILNRTIFAN